MTREAGGSPFVLEQLARYAGVDRMESGSSAHLCRDVCDAARRRSHRMRAASSRRWRSAAGRWRPSSSATRAGSRATGSRSWRCSAPRISFAAAARRSGSRRITIGSARCLPRRLRPDAVRRIHGLMVQALVDRRSDDCEALFEHYRGAGDAENASIQAGLAAAKGGHGARLRSGRVLLPARSGAERRHRSAAGAWREGLANALANAGRPAEAAEAYLRAAAGAGHAERVELQRRAAEQFLIGGHIDRGLDLIRSMLASMGVRVPRSPRGALLWLLWRRARLRWRGLRFVPAAVDDIDAETLLRVDTCWSAATGLALVDMISASEFSARHLLMALDAGEPYRIARAMAIESAARVASIRRGEVGRETARSSQRRWRRASETRTRSPCPSWRTASLRSPWANGRRP